MINKVKCRVYAKNYGEHVYQILTGFLELSKKGIIDLEFVKEKDIKIDNRYILMVVIDDKYTILYDLNDSGFIDKQILQEKKVDHYFKRSYSEEVIQALKGETRFHPLGLNYFVKSRDAGKLEGESFKTFCMDRLRGNKLISRFFDLENDVDCSSVAFEHFPRVSDSPKILFMARLWPTVNYSENLTQHELEDRQEINENRAACIRVCKKEFGDAFFGGVRRDDFSEKYYSDCNFDDSNISRKSFFLDKVKESEICIASTGLHGSIGWKFGEYVAASRAIVSEKLIYELPGDYLPGKHYFEFASPDQLVDSIYKLIDDKQLRREMMFNNYFYYHSFVKPEVLVLNSIIKAIN